MQRLECPFRHDVRVTGTTEFAVCGFVQQLTQAPAERCTVDRSACELCQDHPPLAPGHFNPVMPSLILNACSQSLDELIPGSKQQVLAHWALASIDTDGYRSIVPWSLALDVVIVYGPGDNLAPALDSLLKPAGVWLTVWLILDGIPAPPSFANYQHHADVRICAHQETLGLWARIHEILPELTTQYVVVLDPKVAQSPNRVRRAAALLEQHGAEIFATSLVPDKSSDPLCGPQPESQLFVARRGTLVDMLDRELDHPLDWELLVNHARRSGRAVLPEHEAAPVGSPPQSVFRPLNLSAPATAGGLLKKGSDTFRQVPFAGERPPAESVRPLFQQAAKCDVVLPFRDQLDYVRESLESLLHQEDAELTIHLVDDASQQSTEAFMAEFRGHPRIRCYRNTQNIGPFSTFNNISEFAETPFLAVQDADDISLPHRIAICQQLLERSGTDLIGGRTELFGLPQRIDEIAHETVVNASGQTRHYRTSRYPARVEAGYFLENPTLMIRTAAFRRLGGYADFGERNRNRTGVDTEFQLRAHYSRTPIMVTHELLVRYRCHGESATTHPLTGVGSQAYLESDDEVHRRLRNYLSGTFDPRWFGALRLHAGVTKRI